MKTRSFAELMIGVVAYVSLSSFIVLTGERPRGRRRSDTRWALPIKHRRRRRVAEDACRHCRGTGHCEACMPVSCRVCHGSGLQPRDTALVTRLNQLWDGV